MNTLFTIALIAAPPVLGFSYKLKTIPQHLATARSKRRFSPAPAKAARVREPIDLRPLLHAMPHLCADDLSRSGVALNLQPTRQPLVVAATEDELRRLLSEVVRAACHVMDAGSVLSAEVQIQGRQAVVHWPDLSVKGAGERRIGLFEALIPGAQAHLAIARQIAGDLHGRIYSAPRGHGQSGGMGVTLRLPLHRLDKGLAA